jgi:hypothetical protein
MKTNLLWTSALLALFALALPLTGANDTTKPDPKDRPHRDDAGLVLVAQASSQQDKTRQGKATNPKAASQKQPAKNSAAAKSKRLAPITAKMEAQVGKFVREHHPELHDVLAHLKVNVPKEYERAVRDLNRHRLRLQTLEGRDRHAAELELWKAQSRARLLGAKVQMGDDKGQREALRKTLVQVYNLRVALLQRDRDRSVERLRKLDDQLESLQKNRDKNLARQLLTLTKTSSKRTKSIKTSARKTKPASNKKSPAKKSPANTLN